MFIALKQSRQNKKNKGGKGGGVLRLTHVHGKQTALKVPIEIPIEIN